MVQKLKKSESEKSIIRPIIRYRKEYRPLAEVWSLIIWLVGILVSLAVGFGMSGGTLIIPYIPDVITITAGWIVIILALLGVLLKLIDKISG